MKVWKRITQVLLVVALIITTLFALPKPNYSRVNIWRNNESTNEPLIMAHGGGRAVNPGNTMRAFKYAASVGADVLEMDVHLTKDGILVLRHGENNTGNIRSMSNCDTVIWEEDYEFLYDNCNFGYNFEDSDGSFPYRNLTQTEWVEAEVYMTKLEDVLSEFGNDILYVIEIKADADAPRNETADALYDLVKEYDLLDYVMFATSFSDISTYIATKYPEVFLSASHDEAEKFILSTYSFTSTFYKPQMYSGLQIPTSYNVPVVNNLSLANRLLVGNAHRHNMFIHYWTINNPDDMRYLIELGCDGIITDYPELLAQVIDEYNEE